VRPHIRDGFPNDSADFWPETIDPPDTSDSERWTLQIDSKRADSIVDKRHKAQTTNRNGHGTVWTEKESTRQQNGLGQLGPTPGRAGPLRMHNVPSSGTNHSPIYMFAYVVCPNLEAAAVLSKRRKSCTLNEMNLPNVAVQSEFETARNEFTHSATSGHYALWGQAMVIHSPLGAVSDTHSAIEATRCRPPTLWLQGDVRGPEPRVWMAQDSWGWRWTCDTARVIKGGMDDEKDLHSGADKNSGAFDSPRKYPSWRPRETF
jgi:hypothetical protein